MFDAATGADAGKAESVVALTGNRRAVLAAANAALLGGVALLGRAVADAVRRPRPVAAFARLGRAARPRRERAAARRATCAWAWCWRRPSSWATCTRGRPSGARAGGQPAGRARPGGRGRALTRRAARAG